jgi:hypothetical protein
MTQISVDRPRARARVEEDTAKSDTSVTSVTRYPPADWREGRTVPLEVHLEQRRQLRAERKRADVLEAKVRDLQTTLVTVLGELGRGEDGEEKGLIAAALAEGDEKRGAAAVVAALAEGTCRGE